MSKAEISRQTGISAPTVIKIMNYFLENGFVCEAGEGSSALGRKPHILRFNPEAYYSIGVEFEGDFLKLGLVDLLGNIKTFQKVRVLPDFNVIINKVIPLQIEELIKKTAVPKAKILGIGLGIPGVVDLENCILEFAPLVGISSPLDYRHMISALGKKIELPVYVENDVNAAAIGEFVARKLNGESDLLYLSLGTGLGAGIILNGKIRRGKRNSAGEIGYMVFDINYHSSKANAGWMEGLINFETLSKRWPFFPELASYQNIETEDKNNEFKALVEYVAANLALTISNITALLDINLVIIGGETAEALNKSLVTAINQHLKRLCILDMDCQLKISGEPGIVGTAAIVTEYQLDQMLID